jgi:hypothetical protein
MKDTEIVEVLADGTINHFDLDVCNAAAEEALDLLWAKENTVLSFDYTAAVFSLFVDSINILSNSGWTTQELLQEVVNHSAADDNIGSPDCDDEE